jgi:hypothetical protein
MAHKLRVSIIFPTRTLNLCAILLELAGLGLGVMMGEMEWVVLGRTLS